MEITAETLRQIRDEKGMNQKDFANLIGVSFRSYQNYEGGSNIPAAKKLLISSRLNAENAQNIDDSTKKQSKEIFRTKAGTLYEQLPDGRVKIHVPKIPFKAYASFIETFQDEYDESQLDEAFENISFTVDQIGHGKYVAFTTANDSMNGGSITDTPGGAEVLARKLNKHHWQDGFRPTEYGWIIVSQNGIFHKDIENTDTPGKIICKSRNPSLEFPDFPVILDEVHSIWKVIKRTF